MKEWPLVVFTLSIQLACGLALAATVFNADPMRPLAMATFPLVALGVAFSIAHLGRPLGFWRAFRSIRQSPLSLEIAVTAVFAVLALAYSVFWATGRVEGRLLMGAITSGVGVAAVIASALVYMVPAQPAWNSGWVPISFVGTAVLLGGITSAVFVADAGVSPLFRTETVVGGLLLLIAAVWMLVKLPRPWHWKDSVWLGCYLALVSILPAAAAFGSHPAPSVLAAVRLGAVIGRGLMYSLSREPF